MMNGDQSGECRRADGDGSDSRAAIAYRNIARRMLGDAVPLMQLEEKSGMISDQKVLRDGMSIFVSQTTKTGLVMLAVYPSACSWDQHDGH